MFIPTLSSKTTSLTINQLTVSFDKKPLFQDLSFSLPLGKWTCLLGKSGIGKSTLLRFIAGLAEKKAIHFKGACYLGNRLLTPADLSYLPQQDALLPWLTVIDNALLGVRLRKKTVSREKAIRYLQAVGLSEYLQKRPSCLSGGMRQRVALVRVLLEDTPLVLMDEPFSSLDAITRGDMQNLALQLLENKTVLFITHDPLEALRLGDEIRIVSGSPAVLSEPIRLKGDHSHPLEDPEILSLYKHLLTALHQ